MIISASTTQPIVSNPSTSLVEFVNQAESPYKFIGPPAASSTAIESFDHDLLIEELGRLESDWDGYGALPLTRESCTHAKAFLAASPFGIPAPEINPTSNGTIAMEWQSNNGEAFIDIGRTRYSGHIQPLYGNTIFIEGQLLSSLDESFAAKQILAVIEQLLYGTSGSRPFARSIQITESAL